MSHNYLNRVVLASIYLGEQFVPIWMFSTTPGLTEILIEMVLEIFPKFLSDIIGYDVEGKSDGS